MMKRNKRIVYLVGLLAVVFAGGCIGTEPNPLGTFNCDFARNALAAFLL